MRSLNSDVFTCTLVLAFEFNTAEGDRFLIAKPEDQLGVLREMLAGKSPTPESVGCYSRDEFRKALGAALADKRERELKQLTETTTCAN